MQRATSPKGDSGARRSLASDSQGAAYAEFLIAFPIVTILFLSLVQLSLLYVAKLSVRHAANRAVRAAIVVLPDDPAFYDGEEINQVDFDEVGGAEPADLVFGGEPSAGRGSPRIRAIRSAAYLPLIHLAPSVTLTEEVQSSIRTAVAATGDSFVTEAIRYNRAATSVTFPERPGSDDLRERFGPRELITARVTYVFHCGVPLVKRFICDAAMELGLPGAGAPAESRRPSGFGRLDRTGGPHSDIARGLDEMQHAELFPGIAPWAERGRFLYLRAEASMPNQGAGYRYE
ncbi:MAG: pilus assembly protein [Myxococcales bacterium]|nr:pilus assembly protein [Myxococcales bacterium]